MPKKPRTNKRPPPKANPPKSAQSQTAAPTHTHPATTAGPPAIPPNRPDTSASSQYSVRPRPRQIDDYLDENGEPLDFSSFVPPPLTIDPRDPNFPTALSDWSASTLGKLNAMPKLTQGQLTAIAEAAVSVAHPGAGANGATPPGSGAGALVGAGGDMGGTVTTSANGLPIDLPASLAALFEAKLTLDREKAKLLRMQKELKAHREQMHGVGSGGAVHGSSHSHAHGHGHGHGHHHSHALVQGNGKGKEVAIVNDQVVTCSCGEPCGMDDPDCPGSPHSHDHSDGYCYDMDDDDYACSAGCGCDCHFHDHEEDCDCEDCQMDGHDHDHDHDHEHDHDHDHDHGHHHHHHGHHHHHHHHHHQDEEDEDEEIEHEIDIEVSGPYPAPPGGYPAQQGDIAEQVRNATAQLKNATAEANRAALLAETQTAPGASLPFRRAMGMLNSTQGPGGYPKTNLSEDPDRLDELVRELFNWIKAVVWTIEQAAVVAGRRNWHNQSQVD